MKKQPAKTSPIKAKPSKAIAGNQRKAPKADEPAEAPKVDQAAKEEQPTDVQPTSDQRADQPASDGQPAQEAPIVQEELPTASEPTATDQEPKVAESVEAGKAAAGKPAKPFQGPGVIASIVEFLKAADSAHPLSKADLLKKLSERFPSRPPEAMAKTINCQVPTRLAKEKQLTVKGSTEAGFWIEP